MERAMIVTPQPEATEAGREVLAGGGNAFDAAVVAALVQCVVDPLMTSLGGSGCAVSYRGDEYRAGVLSFMSRAGSKVRAGMWARLAEPLDVGYPSACVPGNVRGLATLLHEHGTIPNGCRSCFRASHPLAG
jgi:gamma-glutamyltranspeptidase/glutathione hydrolase